MQAWPPRGRGEASGALLTVGVGGSASGLWSLLSWLQMLVSLSIENLKAWYTGCDLLHSFGHGHFTRNALSFLQPRNPLTSGLLGPDRSGPQPIFCTSQLPELMLSPWKAHTPLPHHTVGTRAVSRHPLLVSHLYWLTQCPSVHHQPSRELQMRSAKHLLPSSAQLTARILLVPLTRAWAGPVPGFFKEMEHSTNSQFSKKS